MIDLLQKEQALDLPAVAQRLCQRRCRVFTLFLLATFAGGTVLAQDELCDPTLPRLEHHPHGYKKRGDRCEGIYAEQPVSGTTLREVASFTKGPVRYELTETPLTVSWPPGLERPVRLRATSLRSNLFYQMDTLQPADSTTFKWPLDFLSSWQIGPRELGILGWAMVPMGGEQHPVHLPLTVHQGQAGAERQEYRLIVVTGVELRELFISVDQLNEQGEVVAAVVQRKPLGYGYYPPESGIPMVLPDLPEPGIYRMKLIGERRRDGLKSTKQFWFYYP